MDKRTCEICNKTFFNSSAKRRKNYAFFYKQQGENHPILNREDYAIGFMNDIMENKLKEFGNRIVYMDGTDGTNRKGLELTVVLVEDDTNSGFPVAFFLSNRLDQIVQDVFLDALKNSRNLDVKPQYFMSDDDPKYFNAWVKVTQHKPNRLLCTWHIIKNWNIQERNKIKNPGLKKTMKNELKRILNETNKERFQELAEIYISKLEAAEEVDFLNYLKKYYFQNDERIAMWAHCFRLYAGINTNMAFESLNNLLKTGIIKRKANVTVEYLLDKLDDLVDGRMWQRILKIERPNANNYQDKITIKSHKKAEEMRKENLNQQMEKGTIVLVITNYVQQIVEWVSVGFVKFAFIDINVKVISMQAYTFGLPA